jgi:hypothetical protein
MIIVNFDLTLALWLLQGSIELIGNVEFLADAFGTTLLAADTNFSLSTSWGGFKQALHLPPLAVPTAPGALADLSPLRVRLELGITFVHVVFVHVEGPAVEGRTV